MAGAFGVFLEAVSQHVRSSKGDGASTSTPATSERDKVRRAGKDNQLKRLIARGTRAVKRRPSDARELGA